MEEKLVLQLSSCKKCISKAMKIAAAAYGVSSLALEGERKNQLVVVGEGVDPVCLVKALKKKVGYTQILNFAPVTQKVNGEVSKTGGNNETKGPEKPTTCACQHDWPPYVYTVIWQDPCSIL